jgi:ubiquinone/menaquinone biosynthesis C-methylase UbiE
MSTSTQWQLTRESAERYEDVIVPTILGPFARALVEWAAPARGATILDVGCGTGAVTRIAAEQVGPSGRVIGVDVNPGMIYVAHSLPAIQGAPIEWHEQSAYSLPLADQSIDMVFSAQMLQFLPNKDVALAEMYRVLKPGGRVAISAWSAMQEIPYFQVQVEAAAKYLGAEVAAGLKAGFGLSDADEFRQYLDAAGFTDVEMIVCQLDLPLPNLKEFAARHIRATPLVASFNTASPAAQQALIEEIVSRLAQYETNSGAQIPFRSHFVRARK